jgi:hypothetical protein
MNDQNRFSAGRRGPGRPEQSLEIQLELIQSKEANQRWDKIFKLLEGEAYKSEDHYFINYKS